MGRYSVLLSAQMADLAGVTARAARPRRRAAVRGRSPASSSGGSARLPSPRSDPSTPFVEAAPVTQPGRRRPPGIGRGAALRGRDVRRRARPARRPLHDRSGRRDRRDAPRRPAGRRRRGLRLGPRRRARSARRVLDRRRATWTTPSTTNPTGRRPRGPPRPLFAAAGLGVDRVDDLTADLTHPTFESWWEPFTQGVGPAGAYVAGLDAGPTRGASAPHASRASATARSSSRHGPGRSVGYHPRLDASDRHPIARHRRCRRPVGRVVVGAESRRRGVAADPDTGRERAADAGRRGRRPTASSSAGPATSTGMWSPPPRIADALVASTTDRSGANLVRLAAGGATVWDLGRPIGRRCRRDPRGAPGDGRCPVRRARPALPDHGSPPTIRWPTTCGVWPRRTAPRSASTRSGPGRRRAAPASASPSSTPASSTIPTWPAAG